jgi:hypothetical protein
MKILMTILIVMTFNTILKSQIDTVQYDDGSFCIYDKSFRPKGVKSMPFMKLSLMYDTLSQSYYRDYQICYDKNGVITYEFKYLSKDRGDYIRNRRNKNGVVTIKEIAIRNSKDDYYIFEEYRTDDGKITKTDIWQGKERTLTEYHKNSTIKKISRWKEIETSQNDSLDVFEDEEEKIWVQFNKNRVNEFNIFVPIGLQYEFYSNGIIKSIGSFDKKSFWLFKNQQEYEEYLKNNQDIKAVKMTVKYKKIGKWEYYDEYGKLIKIENHDK